MDQKRAWKKAVGRKRYLRILATILSFCVLFTSFPSLPAALTVFAASEETDIPPDDEKIPGGGLNDNVEDTPSTKQEKTEESGGTEETTVPDKDTDGTGEEGGAGENTSPEGEEETEESEGTDETIVPDKDTDGTEEEDEETVDAGHEENGTDAAVQALLARIDALPDAEEYLAAEPDVEDEDAYAAWEEKLYECAEEALSIMEEYETLTEEQQAFISGEELAKLTAWTEIAEIAGESAQVMAAAPHFHDGISFDTPLPADGGELASGNYYLDKDVALKNAIVISSGAQVNLCLNEHKLCRSEYKNDDCPINVYGQLQVYACSDRGIVSGTPITGESTVAVRVAKQGMLTLHSGKITGSYTKTVDVKGTFHLYGGTVECTYKSSGFAIDSLYFFYPCPGSRVNSGIASVYGRFRYFSLLHNFTFHHFSSHLFAPQSSKSSSKFFRKSGRQPFHFLAGGSISSVCIVVQSHIDAVVPHDILQCFRVHPGTCHFRAERMP